MTFTTPSLRPIFQSEAFLRQTRRVYPRIPIFTMDHRQPPVLCRCIAIASNDMWPDPSNQAPPFLFSFGSVHIHICISSWWPAHAILDQGSPRGIMYRRPPYDVYRKPPCCCCCWVIWALCSWKRSLRRCESAICFCTHRVTQPDSRPLRDLEVKSSTQDMKQWSTRLLNSYSFLVLANGVP